MLKRIFSSLLFLLTALALTLGAAAATNLEAISAYLNRGLTIVYEGEAQQMHDVLGNEVFPVTYNGTTYLPVRALAELFDVSVDYDDDTKTVTLGGDEKGSDFIADLAPYDGKYSLSKGIVLESDDKVKSIAGTDYNSWIFMNNTEYLYYNLGAEYECLEFSAYCAVSTRNDRFELKFYGDGVLLESFNVSKFALPERYSVDLTGVSQLRICAENPDGKNSSSEIYLFDMSID